MKAAARVLRKENASLRTDAVVRRLQICVCYNKDAAPTLWCAACLFSVLL